MTSTTIEIKAPPKLSLDRSIWIARGDAFEQECKRRRVKFLPVQVMRPVWEDLSLGDGLMARCRPGSFLMSLRKLRTDAQQGL